MRAHTKIQLAIVGGSVALHLAGWAAVGLFGKERKHDTVAIELAESKKKKEEKEKPPPPPPPEIAPQKAKVVAPAPKAPEPVPEAKPPSEAPKSNDMSGFADLGIGPLSNGGGGGFAVPTGGGGGAGGGGGPPQPAPTVKPRHVALAPQGECAEEMVKPKISHVVTPAYPEIARQANKEGEVRLELTIDATGHVVAVKVLSGLGFGMDEAATAAAKQWVYTPATRCGKAVPTTVVKRVPFHLT